METKPTHSRAWMADDNQDVDPKSGTQDPKEEASREGVVKPEPFSADPPDEDNKTDTGSKTDRTGEVEPKRRG